MNAVRMRAGGPADLDAACEVWLRASLAQNDDRLMPSSEQERVRAGMNRPDAFCVIAEAEGVMVGMGMGMDQRTEDGAFVVVPGGCYIWVVFVVPEWWGRGVGGQILDSVLAEARARGYQRVQLWAQVANARARRLYERRGFRASGREKEHGYWGLLMHMTRALDAQSNR